MSYGSGPPFTGKGPLMRTFTYVIVGAALCVFCCAAVVIAKALI